MSTHGPVSVGDLTKDGGEVLALVPAPDLIARWRQADRIDDITLKNVTEILRRISEDRAEMTEARWNEAAKLAGYESLIAAQAEGISFVAQFGTAEIVVIRQRAP